VIPALATLLTCQWAGELISHALHLPVPGPVIGMVLLFAWLLARNGDNPAPLPLAQTADTLLTNLGLLFVPAGVGVVIYGPLLARAWVPIALAVLVGTLIGIAVTGRLAQTLLKRLG